MTMSALIAYRYYRFPESSDEHETTQERQTNGAPSLALDARDIADAAVTAIASAWARHSATAGCGD